jgi:hypothetical protein
LIAPTLKLTPASLSSVIALWRRFEARPSPMLTRSARMPRRFTGCVKVTGRPSM